MNLFYEGDALKMTLAVGERHADEIPGPDGTRG